MDLREQPHGTGPSGDGIALPQIATVAALPTALYDCLRATVRGRGLRHIGNDRFAACHFHELEPTRAWALDAVATLALAGLVEWHCEGRIALPTDAAYRLLDGVA